MIKQASLRAALIETNPALATEPEKLAVYIEGGRVAATLGRSNAWRYHYTLNITLIDWAGHPDSLFAPLLAWVRIHQPDLLLNPDTQNSIEFEVEILADQTYDIAIKLPLSESVVLSEIDGRLHATHTPEPKLHDYPEGIDWRLFVKGIAIDWPPATTEDMNIPAWLIP